MSIQFGQKPIKLKKNQYFSVGAQNVLKSIDDQQYKAQAIPMQEGVLYVIAHGTIRTTDIRIVS